ncbi:MAG: hypothetical protein GF364_19895 [Candidatus Lokiarchaeota archaeon]|nr:hypothetical protein [Candidatus Lokiarchaeota archaeon]
MTKQEYTIRKKFKSPPKYTEEVMQKVDIFSQTYSRLIAGFILTILGMLELIVLGTGTGQKTLAAVGHGAWMILGGFSWFYLIGLMPLIIGISLIFYYIFSIFSCRVAKSNNFYIFHEKRLNRSTITEIPINKVEAIQFRNNFLGPKKIWILIFVPFSIYILQWGIPLFGQPRAEDAILPTMILISAILSLISMIILVLFPQDYLELVTKENYYEFWFNPRNLDSSAKELLNQIFGTSLVKVQDQRGANYALKQDTSSILKKLPFRIKIGCFILVISLISGFVEIFFANSFLLLASAYGVILIIEGLLDFKDPKNIRFYQDNQKSLKIEMKKGIYYQNLKFNKLVESSEQEHFKSLDLFDIFFSSYLIVVATLQTTFGWVYLDTSSVAVILDMVFTTILLIVMIFSIMTYFCIEIQVKKITTANIDYKIQYSEKRKMFDFIKKLCKKELRHETDDKNRIFLIRIGYLISIIVLSIGICVLIA